MSNSQCFACRSFIQKIVKAFLYIGWVVPCSPNPPPFFFFSFLIQLESFPVLPVTYAHSWTLEAQPWAQAASGSTQVCILLFVQSIFLGVSGTGILGYPSLKMLSPLKKTNTKLISSKFCISSSLSLFWSGGEGEQKKKRGKKTNSVFGSFPLTEEHSIFSHERNFWQTRAKSQNDKHKQLKKKKKNCHTQ